MSPISTTPTLDVNDGSIALAPLRDHHYKALLEMLGYPELLEDPRFNSMGGRLKHMDQVMVIKTPASTP